MNKQLDNVKVALLSASGFEESELLTPKHALQEAGATVCVVSPQRGPLQGMQHDQPASTVDVHFMLDQIKADDFDALLIPGGVQNPDTLRGNPDVIKFVQDFFEAGKPIAAICHGPQVLISADLVEGRKMTAYKTVQKDLDNAGAIVVDEPVVVDRGIVTSRTPQDLPQFCEAIIEEFAEGRHQARTLETQTQ